MTRTQFDIILHLGLMLILALFTYVDGNILITYSIVAPDTWQVTLASLIMAILISLWLLYLVIAVVKLAGYVETYRHSLPTK